ncbi:MULTISPECIES: pyridoxamine 5'-phosphate oxidase [Rhodococcus]|uniref:Pyridoxine/pyridoxamine 5'-phosphate oxidase n=1 Tax=Rhodococcus opacus TaxID=37919 RepID=A0A076EK43_RHOOP|nr:MULTISPECIES: pyridoxamine 5'-phosphate oxidase [Rhodococcus]AII06071.1 pyridoxamine 5'-phosphate oxidase [Rhodococcus opacus]QDQ95653.1 pyridoxamine 5'-phosphate oxidase [Rhodococcus sp. WB9]WAM18692.1 pyridoxamine 5'-phosphate oxidase [Rhodococcus sp. JS3073]
MNKDLAAMRVGYAHQGADGRYVDSDLDADQLSDGWLPLMRLWLEDAVEAGVPEPNAMTLGTVDEHGHPCTRTVLCKGLSADGVLFFTNYDSDKGRQLEAVPYASVTFTWVPVARQITVRGPVERVSAEVTDEYWHSRPRGSRLGAWASEQSKPIGSRAELDAALLHAAERFPVDVDIPVRPDWGGILIRPAVVEFWQGRANRMHNRIRTSLVDGSWTVERLQP